MSKIVSNKLALTILLTTVIAFSINTAYAQTEVTEPIPELVDGVSTTILIAIIAVIGIGLQTYKGLIGKSRSEFDINQLIFTFIVGTGSAIILVGNAFQNISVTMNGTELMIFMVQQIITVMGAKAAIDIGKKFVPKSNNKSDESDLTPTEPSGDVKVE